jgi:phosphoribosylformylglycinamidine synthase
MKAFYKGEKVAELPVSLIVDEAPLYDREAREPEYLRDLRSFNQEDLPTAGILDSLKKLLSSPNIADKSWVYTQYDHQVGTNTVLKPGSDAALLRLKWPARPHIDSDKGVAISCEGNGKMVYLNPYEGTIYVVAEVVRNLACVGARPLAMTDCLNFGNPERPQVMWQFIQSVRGMAKACEELSFPVISGNVSLYNETVDRERIRNVFPTPIVVGVGVIDSVEDYLDHIFQEPSEIYLIGDINRPSLIDGSEYLKVVHGLVKGDVPRVNLQMEKALIETLLELNGKDLLLSAHDISAGGLVVTILESLFPSRFGAEIEIYSDERPDFFLFSETPTRVVVSVKPEHADELKDIVEKNSLGWAFLGRVVEEPDIKILYNGELILQ